MTEYCLASRTGVRTVLLAAAVVALAACASSSGEWTKTAAYTDTPDTMAADLEECKFFGQAASLSAINQPDDTYTGVSLARGGDGAFSITVNATTHFPGAGTLGYAAQGDAFASCMEARGYMQATAP